MIRVLRVLEYEYDDHAHYERDSANWTTTLPSDKRGGRNGWRGPRLTSAVVRVQEISSTTPLPPPPRCTSITPRLDGHLPDGFIVETTRCVLPQGHDDWHSDGNEPTPMRWTELQP